ncbi:hypothetical protein [Legionella bononiensis]|uniref:Uncharacterized protein n=1 Tax=Legionella bononiensis TaxID=2793102 RepID=A0ABS1WDH0_9GAMM|nr:hypothetical protein [Legionella bononiensis]MBL7481375.1 hypothetical protein [Legionella bononiensis]MBL7527407.1 hypothetical protein [Legionella bononiensis]
MGIKGWNRDELTKLLDELNKPVQLSATVSMTIKDCDPTTGKYKHDLPKGYPREITAIS